MTTFISDKVLVSVGRGRLQLVEIGHVNCPLKCSALHCIRRSWEWISEPSDSLMYSFIPGFRRLGLQKVDRNCSYCRYLQHFPFPSLSYHLLARGHFLGSRLVDSLYVTSMRRNSQAATRKTEVEGIHRLWDSHDLQSRMSAELLQSAPNVRSNPEHLIRLLNVSKAPTASEVGSDRLKLVAQQKWPFCIHNNRPGADKREREPRLDLSPQSEPKVLTNFD